MSSTIFRSSTSQHRWVDQLNDHFIVYVNSPPSIFQVPKSTVDTNPGAYAPQEFGIGPYHHFRCDLDDMESRKFGAIKTFLKPAQLQNFKSLVVDKVRALEPSIRSCYDKYLDLDSDTLAWAMAIDGVYLLHLLSTYTWSKFTEVGPDGRKLAQDVLMMENQFPSIVLNEIWEALFPPQSDRLYTQVVGIEEENKDVSEIEEFDESEDRKEWLSEILFFCKNHSPLDIGENAPPNSPHILDTMYRLVVLKLSYVQPKAEGRLFKEVVGVAAEMTGIKPLESIANLPLEEFFNVFGNANSSTNSSIKEIQIPSVSQLQKVSKIQFQKSTLGRAVRYDEKTRTFHLPLIRINSDSEAILRNLVAYELALGMNDNVVSGYVDLMCALIDTAKDVDLLKEKGIIDTILPSEEVAEVFNGINKSSGMVDVLQEAAQKLNKAYDSTFKIRCFRFVKNHLIPSKIFIKIALGVLLVFSVSLQGFCQFYGCSAHWFASN